jgi:hypothetical protein
MGFGYHDPQTLCQLTFLCGDFLNKESTAIIQDIWRTFEHNTEQAVAGSDQQTLRECARNNVKG